LNRILFSVTSQLDRMVSFDENLHRSTPNRGRSRNVSVNLPTFVLTTFIELSVGVESEEERLVRNFFGDEFEA